jgi:2-oxoglutarate dehydrogenase E2 component (dihydrolipoamide succinyltransferase)
MRTDVVMPQMGESVTEGTVTKWLKTIGDKVDRDEPILEITTDKVDAEVPSPVEGVLVEVFVEPGETVEINTIIAVIDTEAAEGDVSSAPAAAGSTPAPAETPIAAGSGSTGSSRSRSGNGRSGGARPSNGSAGLAAAADETAADLRRTRSTPLVRKIAAEHGISDLSPIDGTGLSGRVTRDDILGFLESGGASSGSDTPSTTSSKSVGTRARSPHRDVHLPDIEVYERDRIELLSPQRQMIAQHMVASRTTSAHAQTIHELDFSAVVAARKRMKAEFAERGVKLTYTAFIIKAASEALAEYPMVNSSLDGDHIIYRGDVNIGMAVDIGSSLIVPVVRNVDELSLLGVARAINDLAERSRNKKLKPDEVKAGTFTISNHGVFGPEFGVPIINQPQTAIMSTGAIKKRVVVDQKTDAIMVRPTSIWCLSFDHRAIDGATADKFMARMREIIETWE